jgi:hypothetical protein
MNKVLGISIVLLIFFGGFTYVHADSVTCDTLVQCAFRSCSSNTFTCSCPVDGATCQSDPITCFDTVPSYTCPNDSGCGNCPEPPPPPPECDDGDDNDGDGETDYPNDPGCTSFNDNNEWNAPPGPTTGSITINSNNSGVGWSLAKNNGAVGCSGSGSGYCGGMELTWWNLSINNPANYNCSESSGTYSKNISSSNPDKSFSITCTLITPAPTVNILCNGLNACTVAYNGTANLSWTTTNATSCTASSNPTGGWSGSKSTSGSEAKVSQVLTRTYTLSCSGAGGSGNDSVVVTVPANTAPAATNVTLTQPDYCSFGPGGTISWTYSDPEAQPQSAYQVQVDTNAGFSSIDYDSGKVLSSTNAATIPQGSLAFNQTNYRVRVSVWDSINLQSAWTTMTICVGPPGGNPSGCSGNQQSWNTPPFQYPRNISTFTWTPNKPPINQITQFNHGSAACTGSCSRWDWTFGDGTGVNQQDPAHAYSTAQNYNVALRVTDSASQACSATKSLTVQRPIPNWKEIFPR